MREKLLPFDAKALLICAFVLCSTLSSAQIFRFGFNNSSTVTVDNAVGTPAFLNGVGNNSYTTSNPCEGSRLLSQSGWDLNDYFQFTVNTTGYGNMSLSFCHRADNTSLGSFIIAVSSDGGSSWTTVLDTFTPTTNNVTLTTGAFPASANNKPEVRIRFIKTSDPNNLRTYFLDNVILDGEALPSVTGFSPGAVCAGSTVAITGTRFTNVTAVQVNGADVASFTVNSATSITATLAQDNTTGAVTVSNALGSGSSSGNLTVNPLAVMSVSPDTSNVCQGGVQMLGATSEGTVMVTIGTGTVTNAAGNDGAGVASGYPAPYGANYENTKQQYLIRASELIAAGVTAGPIGSVAFDVTTLGAVGVLNGYTISIGHSSQNALSTWGTGLTTVFGPAAYTPVSGANTHTFATPFVWNGTSNIIVQVCHTNDASNSGNFYTVNARSKYSSTAFNSSMTLRQDNVAACPANDVTYTEAQRPNMVFAMIPKVTWSPVTNLYTDAAATVAYVSGAHATTVYAKPTANRTYTVTSTPMSACANTATADVTVSPLSAGGTLSGTATVCSGSNSGTLNLSGHTGNVVRWEYSVSGGATWVAITNTGTAQTYTNLTQTRLYRAVVQSGSCAPATSNVVTITVTVASAGGTVAGSTTVCASANSGTLTLSGHSGNVVRWESSDLADFSAGVLHIPNSTATLNYVNVSGTTYYRAVVANGVCLPGYSTVAEIAVDAPAAGGTTTGAATVCYGNNSGSVSVSGFAGAIVRWESSTDDFATVTALSHTSAVLSYSNLTATTSFRAVVAGGTCGNATSAPVTVTVDSQVQWIGTASTDWDDPANWSCGIVPTTAVDVTIADTANQPVVATDAFAHTLTLETGTTLTVQTNAVLRVIDAIDIADTALLTVENDANLIQVNDVANTGTAVVKRNSNPLKRLDYILWSAPVSGQNLLSFSPSTIASRFYIYNPATNVYNAITPSANNFTQGTGYLIRMPDNHPASPTIFNGAFAGTLNNGNVDLTVANNTFNAIGNPYPSAIDADAFIAHNNITGALYFWRKTNNDLTTSYATYTLAGGVGTTSNTDGDPMLLTPDGVIQPGQGFITRSTSTTLSFNNAMRIGNNGQFFRQNIERNRIWLNLTSTSGIFSQTMVSYMTGATNGVDATIDGRYFNDSQVALTSMIGTNEYAIQGRALPFNDTDVVPLGFKATAAGTFTIGIDHVDGLFLDDNQRILLRDNLDGSVHDLKLGSYTFATEAGTFNTRFEIVYQTTLATEAASWSANQVIVFKQGQELVVHTGHVVMDRVDVFDIRGRLLASRENVNATEVRVPAVMANQVLVVRVVSKDNKTVSKKVIH